MQAVSSAYLAELARPVAGAAAVRVQFSLTNVAAPADASYTEQNAAVWSSCASAAVEDAAPQQTYATFEPGRTKADGNGLILPDDAAAYRAEGYASAALSGADGVYETPPCVCIAFGAQHTVPALTLTFDDAAGEYPARVRLRALCGETVLWDAVCTPNAVEYCTNVPLVGFDTLEIFFLQSCVPHRRARLSRILFGVGYTFTGQELTKTVQTLEVDPITRRLPQNALSFTIVNDNPLTGGAACLYDPDNPNGVWRYVEQRNPVRLFYGQALRGGGTEWIDGGRYYLTAQPSVSGLTASFTAQALLGSLDGTYEKGMYAPQGQSLAALAQAVLEDAALPPVFAGGAPWQLWSGLAEITTTAPLPRKKHKECLQLIAHAARCVLYTDRTGRICILPAPNAPTGRSIGLADMTAQPKCTKGGTLAAVDCKAYSYTPAAAATVLHSGTYAVNGTLVLHLTYAQAAEVTAAVSGSGISLTAACYAGAADITLTGTGTAALTVTGKPLQTSAVLVRAAVAAPDANAETETLDNPLITGTENAAEVAAWVRDYLLLRTAYACETRGAPELDALDLITAESRFDAGFPARILKSKITYDGGLSGALTLKRTVAE